jgi:hypothetical protein
MFFTCYDNEIGEARVAECNTDKENMKYLRSFCRETWNETTWDSEEQIVVHC